MFPTPRPTTSSSHKRLAALAMALVLGGAAATVAAAESTSSPADEAAAHPELNSPPLGSSAGSPPMEPPPLPKPAPQKPAPKRPVLNLQLGWGDLTRAQQEALAPLAPHWDALSEGRRRKWIALSHNYKSLSPEEQQKLHSRMSEWANLSVQERIQARLNFAQTKKLPPEEKRAQWEAYQALSDEERKELATRAPLHPMGAATPVKPVPAQKLAVVLPSKAAPRSTGKIETGPHHVDMHTLLPTPPAANPIGR